jgi:hypothetical protein
VVPVVVADWGVEAVKQGKKPRHLFGGEGDCQRCERTRVHMLFTKM